MIVAIHQILSNILGDSAADTIMTLLQVVAFVWAFLIAFGSLIGVSGSLILTGVPGLILMVFLLAVALPDVVSARE